MQPETLHLYIVLAVTVFMMVMFIWHKVPFGVTTMTCCVILAATGCVSLNQAFGGFANKIVVLIAPMLAMSNVLTRTALVEKISSMLNALKGRQGMLLVIAFYAVGIIFAQFIPTTAAIAILVVFLSTLGDTGEITANRMLLPLLGVMVAWKFRTPIGLGATTFAQLNAYAEGILGKDTQYAIQLMDPFKFAIIPGVLLTIYCLFFWKLMPKSDVLNTEELAKKQKSDGLLPQPKQNIVYIVFIACMGIMLFMSSSSMMYLAPAAGVLILIYTGCISVPDAVKGMTADMTWMLAGVLVVSDAIGSSGAGEMIGSALLKVLGGMNSPFLVCLIFSAVTVIMTTFISNMGTQSVLIPIAASVALAGGWDPRGLILIIGTANYMAIAFPSGSGEAAVAFATAGYNPAKVLKFTLPFILIAVIGCTLSAWLLYPLY